MSIRQQTTARLLPDLVLLGVAIVWGGSYLAAKDLAAASTAAAVMCARFLPSAVILLAWHQARRPTNGGGRPGLRESLRPGLVLGLFRAATIALETIGVTLTSATNAGLIIGLSVLLTPVLESARTRRRLSASLLGSVMLALAGIAALVGGHGFAAPNLGDLLVLGAALTRACLGVAEAQFTIGKQSDVLTLTTIEIAFGAVIFTLWGGGPLLSHIGGFGAGEWFAVLYLSLGCTILAFLGQLWATKHTSASRASMLLGTEPAWALLTGLVLAGDSLGPIGLIGAATLLLATAWGRQAEQRWRSAAGSGSTRETASSRP